MKFPPPTVPLFVYGSLRPGMALWKMISDEVVQSRPATTTGRLYWHSGMEWPLLTIGSPDDRTVRGDLLSVRPGDAVNRVIVDEELLYGYDARWVRVQVDTAAGTDEVKALVLVWNRDEELGPEIASGDYETG